MGVNRIANLLKQVAAAEGTASSAAFILNPLAPCAASWWQMQIYQAAFLQAQKTVEQESDWPLAEWWN